MSKTFFSKKSAYPWVIWFITTLFFFYKYLLQFSPGVMTSDLMAAFAITGAGLGNLAACFNYPYLLMQFPAGILFDKYNPQKITAAAIFLCAIGAYIFSRADSLVIAYLGRGLIGLGAAFAPVACLKLATVWFPPRRFTFIAGLTMTLALIGAMNSGYPLAHLVAWFGWRGALHSLVVPGIVLSVIVLLVVREKKSPTNIPLSAEIQNISIRQSLKTILSDKQTWLLSLYSGFAYAPFSVLGGLWSTPFLQAAYHLSRPSAAAGASCMFIGFAVGGPTLGWLSERITQRKILINMGTIIMLLTLVIIIYLPQYAALALPYLMFLFGVGMGGFLICFSMVREVNKLFLAGTAIGFMNMFDSLWEALSEPLIGKLLDLGWTGDVAENGSRLFSFSNYQAALSILPLYLVLALVCLFYVKETNGTQKL